MARFIGSLIFVLLVAILMLLYSRWTQQPNPLEKPGQEGAKNVVNDPSQNPGSESFNNPGESEGRS